MIYCCTYFTVDAERQSIIRGGIVCRVVIRSVSVTALPRNIKNCLHNETMSLFTTFSGCLNVPEVRALLTSGFPSTTTFPTLSNPSWVDLLEFAEEKKIRIVWYTELSSTQVIVTPIDQQSWSYMHIWA